MQYIVDFYSGTPEVVINAYMAAHNCTIISTLNHLGLTYLVEAPAIPPMTENDGIETVLEDRHDAFELLAALQDELQFKDVAIQNEDNWWKLAVIPNFDLDADKGQIVRGGQNVRVYVLDSGISVGHEDFLGKDITLLHSKTGDFTDTTGHGTALASVIVGETCGISEAALKVVKVFHKGQPTLVSEILVALQKVAEDFQRDPSRPAVMNLSWAINKNDFVEAKIRALMEMGIVVTAAAGNNGVEIENVTPASMPDVVTVGSFGPDFRPSNFTNYTGTSNTSYAEGMVNFGVGLDVFAPGEQIRVAMPNGAFGYSVGTSIATAITTACIVMVLASNNVTYEDMGYAMTLGLSRRSSVTHDLLILDGVYEDSPNSIPRAKMHRYDPTKDQPAIASRGGIVKGGETFGFVMFSALAYTHGRITGAPKDWVLDGNVLRGEAPSPEKYMVFKIMVEMGDDSVLDSYEFTLVVYNASIYPNRKEALADSGFRELECGCCLSCVCCEGCIKGGCTVCSAPDSPCSG